jgi:hypothetical protein
MVVWWLSSAVFNRGKTKFRRFEKWENNATQIMGQNGPSGLVGVPFPRFPLSLRFTYTAKKTFKFFLLSV